MTNASAKVVTSNGNMTIDLEVNFTQYPLHYVTYVPILRLLRPTVKEEAGGAFVRNVTKARTDG